MTTITVVFMLMGKRYKVELTPAEVPAFLAGCREKDFEIIDIRSYYQV